MIIKKGFYADHNLLVQSVVSRMGSLHIHQHIWPNAYPLQLIIDHKENSLKDELKFNTCCFKAE